MSAGIIERAKKKAAEAHKSRYSAYDDPREYERQQAQIRAREELRKKQAKDLGARDD